MATVQRDGLLGFCKRVDMAKGIRVRKRIWKAGSMIAGYVFTSLILSVLALLSQVI